MKIFEYIKWFFRPTYNCNCPRSRKDNYHDLSCKSWLNDWNWKEKTIKIYNKDYKRYKGI